MERFAQGGTTVVPPEITATRSGARVTVRYRFERRSATRTLLLSVSASGAPDVATARRTRVRRRDGAVSLRLPPASSGPYVVSASAFSQRGARSRVIRATLP